MKRGAISLFVMALFVSACTSVDSTPTTTQPPAVPMATTTRGPAAPTASAEVDVCGSEFPLFVAGLEQNDPKDIDGTPGPGPGSQPAAPGQLVSHWLGEFGYFELRWPPTEPRPDTVDWSHDAASRPAAAIGIGRTRVTLYVQLDEKGGRCSEIAAEVYGPRADPLGDSIVLFMEALRDRGDAEEYLFVLASQNVPSTAGAEYPEGRCSVPVLVDSELSQADALVLVEDFLADRGDGKRAQSCLTGGGLASYQEADQSFWPTLCLFECQDGAAFETVKVTPYEWAPGEDSQYISAVILFSDGEGSRSVVEIYEVVSVTLPSGQTVAGISSVLSRSEIEVDEGTALAFVSDFLRRLAEGQYDIAGILLIGDGVTAEIEDRLPDVWKVDNVALLEEFCSRAICSAKTRIVGVLPVRRFSRDVIIEFDGANGSATKRIDAGVFHGTMMVGGLPPDGVAGAAAVPLVESIFRGRRHVGIAVLGERSMEIWGTDASNEPARFFAATTVENLVAAGGWIVARTREGDVLAAPTTPLEEDGYARIEADRAIGNGPGTMVGGGVVDGGAYAFFVDASDLLAVHLGSKTRRY